MYDVKNKSSRNRLYKAALEIFKEDKSVKGLCELFSEIDENAYDIQNLPEIWSQKPSTKTIGAFWWPTHNRTIRIDVLQRAIKMSSDEFTEIKVGGTVICLTAAQVLSVKDQLNMSSEKEEVKEDEESTFPATYTDAINMVKKLQENGKVYYTSVDDNKLSSATTKVEYPYQVITEKQGLSLMAYGKLLTIISAINNSGIIPDYQGHTTIRVNLDMNDNGNPYETEWMEGNELIYSPLRFHTFEGAKWVIDNFRGLLDEFFMKEDNE